MINKPLKRSDSCRPSSPEYHIPHHLIEVSKNVQLCARTNRSTSSRQPRIASILSTNSSGICSRHIMSSTQTLLAVQVLQHLSDHLLKIPRRSRDAKDLLGLLGKKALPVLLEHVELPEILRPAQLRKVASWTGMMTAAFSTCLMTAHYSLTIR